MVLLAGFVLPVARAQSNGQTISAMGWAKFTLDLLTHPEGADLKPFKSDLYESIRRKWFATMPGLLTQGARGLVVVRAKVQRDGTLSDSSLRIQSSSGNRIFEQHAMSAIRSAAPFDHLPDSFSPPEVELRLSFYYNVLPPPKKDTSK